MRDDDDGRGESFPVFKEEGSERARVVFLFPLDKQRDADIQPVTQDVSNGAQCANVRHDTGLVVGSSPALEAITAQCGLERGRLPLRVHARSLPIVVRVQQNGGRPVARGTVRDYGGGTERVDGGCRRCGWRGGCGCDGLESRCGAIVESSLAYLDKVEQSDSAQKFCDGVG